MSRIRQVLQAATNLEAEGLRVFHFEIGQPDFDTPAPIKEAAKQALDDGKVAYAPNRGIPELRAAIAAKMARDANLRVDPEHDVIVTTGAIEAIFIAMMATLNPGDEVLIPDPGWPHYHHCAQLAQAIPVPVPLQEANSFQVDVDDVRRLVTPRTRMLVINTPHNPTGTVLDVETLRGLASLAIEHDLLILADEIYEKLIYGTRRHHSIASLPGMWERTLTVNGFSKAFSMTGWRLGYLVAPAMITEAAVQILQYVTTCGSTFSQYAAVSALTQWAYTVDDMRDEFARRRKLIVDRLAAMDALTLVEPSGSFYAFPSIRALGISSEAFCNHLLNAAHVATVPGSSFGAYGEGFFRIAYSTSYADVEEGLDRISDVVEQLSRERNGVLLPAN
jgi:aspartate/methionine/tyrosine aminotransferase